MRSNTRWSSVVACLLLPPIAARAQDSTRVHPLDTITVTAERHPSATTATPSAVRVITSDKWRARGVSDLASLLREVPGLQLDPVVGSGTGISIQGLGSDRVQIMVDGSPITGRLNNQLDITRLDLAQFGRIEIVEGPQSTLYGSTALGGVINLITRAPNGRHADLATQGGSYGQLDLSGRVSTLSGVTGIAVSGGHRHIDIAPGHSVGIAGSGIWNSPPSALPITTHQPAPGCAAATPGRSRWRMSCATESHGISLEPSAPARRTISSSWAAA